MEFENREFDETTRGDNPFTHHGYEIPVTTTPQRGAESNLIVSTNELQDIRRSDIEDHEYYDILPNEDPTPGLSVRQLPKSHNMFRMRLSKLQKSLVIFIFGIIVLVCVTVYVTVRLTWDALSDTHRRVVNDTLPYARPDTDLSCSYLDKICANISKKNETDRESSRNDNENKDPGSDCTSFLFSFPKQLDTFHIKPQLLIAARGDARVSVYTFHSARNKTVLMNKSRFVYNLDTEVVMVDGWNRAGVETKTDIPVTAFGFVHNVWHASSEGYLAIPTFFASTKYIVVTLEPSRFRGFSFNSKSIINVMPLESNTEINIIVQMSSGSLRYNHILYQNGDDIDISLNKYETFQLSHTLDLTGTVISTSKPVLLVSGNRCNYIRTPGSCNPLWEMLLPIDQLDNVYVLPLIATRDKSTVRVTAVNETVLQVGHLDNITSIKVNENSHFDFLNQELTYILSTYGVLVMMYPHELPHRLGDIFMMTIHGVHQYLHEYTFVVHPEFTSFISIVIATEYVPGLVLDGSVIDVNQLSVYSIEFGVNKYSTFSLEISDGVHHATHQNVARFGLWVYGNAPYNAYGYPGGIKFK